MLLGGKIGYIIFYHPYYYLHHIFNIFKIWNIGMSFHGGLIGVIITIFIFAKKNKNNFFKITDSIVPFVPFGLGAGRIGNFINGELWGKVSLNAPVSVFFPKSYEEDLNISIIHPEFKPIMNQFGTLPRHPSQLYECFLEGIVLFVILHILSKRTYKNGTLSSIFLIFYGIFRIIGELYRQPDPQIGLYLDIFSIGQILSFPMIIIGIIIIIKNYVKK